MGEASRSTQLDVGNEKRVGGKPKRKAKDGVMILDIVNGTSGTHRSKGTFLNMSVDLVLSPPSL